MSNLGSGVVIGPVLEQRLLGGGLNVVKRYAWHERDTTYFEGR